MSIAPVLVTGDPPGCKDDIPRKVTVLLYCALVVGSVWSSCIVLIPRGTGGRRDIAQAAIESYGGAL